MTPMSSDDALVLVARLRGGDTRAFDEVYDAYRPRVFAFLLRMARNRMVAEDLLDETWLRLVRAAPRLLPDTRLGPWLSSRSREISTGATDVTRSWSNRRSGNCSRCGRAQRRGLHRSSWQQPVNSSEGSNVRSQHSHRNAER